MSAQRSLDAFWSAQRKQQARECPAAAPASEDPAPRRLVCVLGGPGASDDWWYVDSSLVTQRCAARRQW